MYLIYILYFYVSDVLQLIHFGLWVCLDSFLFIFTFLPLRTFISLIHLFGRLFYPSKIKLSPSQAYDLMRASIIIISSLGLLLFDLSFVYHFIRGQATLKLYGLFNLLEIMDKLCCSFGPDIFDSLLHISTPPEMTPKGKNRKLRYFGPVVSYLIALVYTFVHSSFLFIRIITLNVSMNAYNNSLLTLLITNNFVELKGSVFKNFKKDNVFLMTCSDIVERFNLFLFLSIVIIHNLNDASWEMTYVIALDILYVLALVFLMEVLVDWIKHAFIIKFNNLSTTIYSELSTKIATEVIRSQDTSSPDGSYMRSKSVGFHAMPISCVLIRVFVGVAPVSGFLGIAWIALMWVTMVLLKVLTTMITISKSSTRMHRYEFSRIKNQPNFDD